ncbi:glycoside hydrolase family 15 protein [Piscinibacter sp.]|jgi:phosphorylase kinase alpha/beta subunit|uniref:glycoside hydrolase family 15 protein n=1 Tax=Piscinibacter sp. TaxID=1903157 RepID=UPI00355A9C29
MATRRPTRPAVPPARLDAWRAQAEAIILARQDPTTGLLPASTAVTVHGDYTHAWVRDNVYSILAVWALALAYRRVDPAAAAPLEGAVVKLMHGLLAAMMKQAAKVERFKHTQDPLDALHAKYDTARGEPVVGDSEWGHLQIDATAIFVLQLAQMSAAGLHIVEQPDEVAFVQNLVYYLAKAWRTPDYGIWERGHKRNEGVAELNASSVGMAKAALEAIDGFEPLPGRAPAVLVVSDDIASARDTLQALLPRESESKETDAALLSIIGYPAFAIDDATLAARTRATLLEKLQGRYGCKRFLRDGHQTVLEDHARLHYEPGELRQFEHIESEWPLFFTYLLVDAALSGSADEAAAWRTQLDALMQERDGQRLLPELYFVPAQAVEAERASPHSQPREPNVNVPLVWAQSLYIVGVLVQEGHVTADDIDPLGRRHGHALARDVCVQVALLAEDDLVGSRLAARGLAAQTVAALLPLQVHDAAQLTAALTGLGRCAALGLSGRPPYPLGSLATSRMFVRGDERSVCLPAFGRQRGFYLALDNRLLVDEIATEVAALRRHWRHEGQPLLVLLLTGPMLDAPGADDLLDALAKLGTADGVRLGPLEALLLQAAVRRLPATVEWPAVPADMPMAPAADAVLAWDEAATRALTAERIAALAAEHDEAALLQQLDRSRNPYEQVELLALLWRRAGPARDTGLGGDVRQLTEALYGRACRARRWGVVRRAAGLLDMHDEALEDAVAEIVVRGKRVALGRAYSADSVVACPLGNPELVVRLRAHGGDDPRGRVLIEELVLLLGMLIKADAGLFVGTLTLRPWQALLLLTAWLAREHGVSPVEAFDHVLDLSPHAILGRLREVMTREQEMAADLVRMQSLHATAGALIEIAFAPENDPVLEPEQGGWPGWREMTGVIARVPADFHARVWELLQHCAGLVIGDQLDPGSRVDSALARGDTTSGERSFALQVDELLNRIQAPEYRQLTIEALLALSDIARANPELKVDEPLVLDVLIGTAVRLGWQQQSGSGAYNEQVAQAWQAWQAFYASPPHRVANLIMAAVAFLLEETT